MKLITKTVASFFGVFLLLTASSVTKAQSTDATIVDLAVATDSLSTLVDLVTLADLVETLAGDGPFTVLAPTNDAFAELDTETVDALTADPSGALTDVLLYHVIPGKVMSSDLEDGAMVETVNGAKITVSLGDTDVMFNDAKYVTGDIEASNGVVHIIDKVLIPPTEEPEDTIVDLAVATDDLSTLVDLVALAELVETLAGDGPFTVFAPTNDAFAELDSATVTALTDDPSGALTSVLLYHVVPGMVLSSDLEDGAMVKTVNGANVMVSLTDGAMINDANVVAADVMASNGVVHIIDKVLIPPAAGEEEGATDATIVELAVATDDLSTLVELVTLADLVETLAGDGPFTVFAPTNDAFDALDTDLVASLVNDPSGPLTDVLLYHVVPGMVLSSDLEDGAMVGTVNGASVEISLSEDGAMINDANVIAADVMASNGVVHIIDKVLIPPSSDDAESESGDESADYSRLQSTYITQDACMEVLRAHEKERVWLRDCEMDEGGWSYDEDSGLFVLELDPDYCMQADFDPVLVQGTPLRIMPCDPNEPLQQFTFSEGDGIRPKSNTDFCVQWRGDNFYIGSGHTAGDPMILKDCKHYENSIGWEFD